MRSSYLSHLERSFADRHVMSGDMERFNSPLGVVVSLGGAAILIYSWLVAPGQSFGPVPATALASIGLLLLILPWRHLLSKRFDAPPKLWHKALAIVLLQLAVVVGLSIAIDGLVSTPEENPLWYAITLFVPILVAVLLAVAWSSSQDEWKSALRVLLLAAPVVAAFGVLVAGPTVLGWYQNSSRFSCGADPEASQIGVPWGPDREGYTMDQPAPHAVLNSIVDNPDDGNEFFFFIVKAAGDHEKGGFCNSVRVSDGQIVLFRAFVENSAANNLRGESFDGQGMARDVVLRIVPDDVVSSRRVITAYVDSPTTNPRTIWDGVELLADQPFRLDFVQGSGVLYTNAVPSGFSLLDSVWDSDGSMVGYRDLDGIVPPGYEYSMIATAKARVTFVAP